MDENVKRMKDEWDKELKATPGLALWPVGGTPGFRAEYGQSEPSIMPFLAETGGRPRGAVVVCPGGGYELKAPHEGQPIARMLNAAGIHAFVLDYRVIPYTAEYPLMDVQRAIRTVRYRSASWGVNADKVAVLGFSAGGHMTIMASTHFDAGNPGSADPVERQSCRPDAQIPCYPLVSFKPIIKESNEREWIARAFGPGHTAKSIAWSFGDEAVRADTPPAFLWGTWDDFLYEQWPPYLEALKRNKVEFAYHLFPRGGHGMGLAEGNAQAKHWPALCTAWLKEQGF